MSVLINNNHPIFEDNQVLTSGQLNQLTNYLDQQTRLTRSCLIGMGIACGLELEIATEVRPAITIHQGMGISSEGFLLKLCPENESCTTVQYREYQLPQGVVYTPFQDEEFNQDVELFELLTEEAEIGDDITVEPLSNHFLQDKVVLLFLECLDKDLKSCLGKSCDELGIERIFTLRKLLINISDLNKVNARTRGGRQDDLFLEKFNLKDIRIPRLLPLINDESEAMGYPHYFVLAKRYIEKIEQVYPQLRKLLPHTYEAYQPILAEVYGGNPFQEPIIENAFKLIEEYLKGGVIRPIWLEVQYVYDFMKDLILAYDEFKTCAYDLMVQCCPDMTRFPRHLMLGTAFDQEREACETNQFRHPFTQPPVYNQQGRLLEMTISLHKRMVLLLEMFSWERLQESKGIEPKITPSCEKKGPLSLRSIPFYYDSKRESTFEALRTLEWDWNFDRKHRHCQVEDKELKALNRSYDNNVMTEELMGPVVTPMLYDIDALDFLRLEGFHGKEMDEVLDMLQGIRLRANVDFDVKTIYFGDQSEKDPILECFFDDLQLDYEVWRGKLLYLLDGFARLTRVSQYLTTQRVSGKSRGKYGLREEMGMEALHEETHMLRNMGASINRDNWAYAMDEVHFQTKSMNTRNWTSKESGRSGGTTTFSSNKGVGDLHEEMRNCVIAIRNNTPELLRDFDLNQWLVAYKCPLNVFVELINVLASRIPRDSFSARVNTFMRLFCALHELMRNLFIYPYMEARLTSNTLRNRREQYMENHQFFNFLKTHPGLEHKAGVKQGGTFVILTQSGYSDEGQVELTEFMKKYLDQHPGLPFNIEDVFDFQREQQGNVLADFTLPYKCCDPCVNIKAEVAELDPMALPICEVVPIRENTDVEENDPNRFEYLTLQEKLFHTVYEPERYRARLTSNASLGVAELQFHPFDYDPSRNTQRFSYQVDIEKVMQAAVNSESAYLVDVIDYEIYHAQNNEVIDRASINVLVPIIFSTTREPIGFTGMVFFLDEAGNRVPIANAQIRADLDENTTFRTESSESGFYQLIDPKIVKGTYVVRASATGFLSAVIRNVSVDNDVVPLDIRLNRLPILGFDERGLLKHLTLEENSTTAILINEERMKSIKMYEAAIEMALEAEKNDARSLLQVKEAISRFNHDEEISVEELNSVYVKNRDLLIGEIKEAHSRTVKKNKSNALRVLTNSYMDRLLLKEHGKLSAKSNKTLEESAKVLSESKIAMKANFTNWAKRKEKVVGEGLVANFKNKFKIK
ncbi:MAG: carboxypeptidase-like regulatory domain-containing protein [Bacteroidota bacterium]